MPVQKKPAMKKTAAKKDAMKSPAMKKPAAAKPKAISGSDERSGSTSPDQLAELHSALDRAVSQPELLDDPGTPEMDPLQLAEMEAVLDAALQEPGAKPAAKPATAEPDSDSPWTTQSSDSSGSSKTLELPGRDDWPKGADVC